MVANKKYERLLSNYDKHCRRIAKATIIDVNEKPRDKIERIQRLEKDYIAWFEYYFPNYAKKKCAKYHRQLADLLIKQFQVYVLMEAFRSAGKTVHICMGIPLFLYFTKQTRYCIIMGQNAKKAQRLLAGLQVQLRFNQRLINDYGNRFKLGDWAEGDFSTTDDCRFRSFGFGESPRGEQEEGQRPDYIVVDDSDIKKHLNNNRIMEEREDFIFEDLIGCFDAASDAKRRFVFANNNFHKKSLTNRIKQRFKKQQLKAIARHQEQRAGERRKRHGVEEAKIPAAKYHVLSVPAVKDLVSFEPSWPEKADSDFWRALYDDLGNRSFCREYMNIHVEEGKIFKVQYMQWKKMHDYASYDSLRCYGDLSYKDAGDFKAMILVGKKGREFHIIHVFCRQSSRADVAKWLYDLYQDKQLHKYNITYQIEGLFAMDEFVNDFDMEGDDRGFHIPVIPDKRTKEGKYDRIASMEGFFQRLWMFFNIEEREHADQIELLDQMYAFERGSEAHDDGPDALHGAVSGANMDGYASTSQPRIGMIDNSDNANIY